MGMHAGSLNRARCPRAKGSEACVEAAGSWGGARWHWSEEVREIEAMLGVVGATPPLLVVDLARPGFPHRVLRDAVLEPVDKVVWMVLRESGARGRLAGPRGVKGCSRFPGYARIAKLANVGSKSTVTRAMAVLRAQRWLSLCVGGTRQREKPQGVRVRAARQAGARRRCGVPGCGVSGLAARVSLLILLNTMRCV